MIYVFGGFLIITGFKLLLTGDHKLEPEKNPVVRLVRRVMRVTHEYHGQHFFLNSAVEQHEHAVGTKLKAGHDPPGDYSVDAEAGIEEVGTATDEEAGGARGSDRPHTPRLSREWSRTGQNREQRTDEESAQPIGVHHAKEAQESGAASELSEP